MMDYTQIKTFEDACACLGITEETLPALLKPEMAEITPEHIKAELKLEIIAKALNEGWEYHPGPTETAYWPWFGYITERNKAAYPDVIDISGYSKDYAGLVFAYSFDGWSNSHALIGSRLVCKSSAIAVYFGMTFTELWSRYLFIPLSR